MGIEFTEEEWKSNLQLSQKLNDSEIAEELERLANREKEFLERIDPKFQDYESIRDITIFNIIILCAASERLSQLQKVEPKIQT